VQALEEEGNAEKHQLAAMHQQRVLAHINQRKREAMTCYTQALTELPPNVSIEVTIVRSIIKLKISSVSRVTA
jgi:hypothetical protein